MSEARIVDYYAILAIPPGADFTGVQNAYARLSDEIGKLMGEDETIREGIARLNEAYAVLGSPENRRKYDEIYFSQEIADAKRAEKAIARRKQFASRILVSTLVGLVLLQVSALAYLGRDTFGEVVSTVLGPLSPDSAG